MDQLLYQSVDIIDLDREPLPTNSRGREFEVPRLASEVSYFTRQLNVHSVPREYPDYIKDGRLKIFFVVDRPARAVAAGLVLDRELAFLRGQDDENLNETDPVFTRAVFEALKSRNILDAKALPNILATPLLLPSIDQAVVARNLAQRLAAEKAAELAKKPDFEPSSHQCKYFYPGIGTLLYCGTFGCASTKPAPPEQRLGTKKTVF